MISGPIQDGLFFLSGKTPARQPGNDKKKLTSFLSCCDCPSPVRSRSSVWAVVLKTTFFAGIFNYFPRLLKIKFFSSCLFVYSGRLPSSLSNTQAGGDFCVAKWNDIRRSHLWGTQDLDMKLDKKGTFDEERDKEQERQSENELLEGTFFGGFIRPA